MRRTLPNEGWTARPKSNKFENACARAPRSLLSSTQVPTGEAWCVARDPERRR